MIISKFINIYYNIFTIFYLTLTSCCNLKYKWNKMFKTPGCQGVKITPENGTEVGIRFIDAVSCLGNCARDPDCIGANYLPNDKTCVFFGHEFDMICTSSMTESLGGIYYDKRTNPCLNDGNYVSGTCQCIYPYVGKLCQQINRCYNGGKERGDGFCDCPPDFCGELCDQATTPGCLNGGCYIDNQCSCTRGYHGSDCAQIIKDCKEGFDLGKWQGVVDIFVVQPSPSVDQFKVHCDMNNKGNTIFQQRSDSNIHVDFNTSWLDYEQGFGNLDGNYWLGLKKMYYLASTRAERSFYVSINGKMRQYPTFTMDDHSTSYTITVSARGGWDNGLNDIMAGSSGKRFSTYDSGDTVCATAHGGGWWFDGTATCTPCYPNSPLTVQCMDVNVTSTSVWLYYP